MSWTDDLLARLAQLEAQQLLHVADTQRAHTAGQGQALRALSEHLVERAGRYGPDDLEPEYIEGFKDAVATAALWIHDKLKELGEEPGEER